MRKIPLVIFLGAVAALALSVWLPDQPRDKIARSEVFARKLEHALRIPPETTHTIVYLVASMHAYGMQKDSVLESRRLAAIARLEAQHSASLAITQSLEDSASEK